MLAYFSNKFGHLVDVGYGKAEKVIDVALIVDDGTGWISCRKWFCVLTEKFSASLLILIFSFTFSFCFMEFKSEKVLCSRNQIMNLKLVDILNQIWGFFFVVETSFDLCLTLGGCMSTLTVEM